jgi:hypothetical protein
VPTDSCTKTIELELRTLPQLFNSMDPSPFHERDLDDDAEKYIVSWATEYPSEAPLRLIVRLIQPLPEGDAQAVVSNAVEHFFAYRAEMARRELRDLLRRGRLSLLIGLVFIAVCLATVQLLSVWSDHTIVRILKESLVIGGWVALWRPMEIFLYDWWPIARLRRLYERLSRMTVEVRLVPQVPPKGQTEVAGNRSQY